jgi:aerobic carbon-monoxide dehydrogenase medium subunit
LRTASAEARRTTNAAAAEAPVIGDACGSAGYKRELLRVYFGRAVRQALSTGAGERTMP